MSNILHYDEAWNGVDALSIINNPRATPFLINNFGRESGWMYWIIPYILAFGSTAFALRLATMFTTTLTLAATYRLSRELFDQRTALWSTAIASVFYWLVHISHLALRSNLFILIGVLACATLLTAYRKNTYRCWLVGGFFLGLLAYTYFASAAWILYLFGITLGVALIDKRRRHGALLALGCALVIYLPMALYFLNNSEKVLSRSTTVSAISIAGLIQNSQLWLAAWFKQGDTNVELNLPGRPILGPITGLFGAMGLIELVTKNKKIYRSLFLVGLGLVAWLPSLLSNQAPHFLRASSLTIPVCILLGLGINWLNQALHKILPAAAAQAIPALMLIFVGVNTYQDFHQTWIQHPNIFILMEQHINQAIDYIGQNDSANTPVYFSPLSPSHPVILYRAADLAPRPIAAFDSHQCLVVPENNALYVSLTIYEPSFETRLGRWATVEKLHQDTGMTSPRYSVFRATSKLSEINTPQIQFGGAFDVQQLSPISDTLSPGESVTFFLGVRKTQATPVIPSLFVHLYGDPTPYEGGALWAQADSQICATYPSHLWRSEEVMVQAFELQLPPDIPAGTYSLAIGMYPYPEGERLAISPPQDTPYNYIVLQEITLK